MRIEYLSWSPTREVFVQTMQNLVNPLSGEPLASVDPETGEFLPSEGVIIDEIGPIVFYDDDGEVSKEIEGHHVNLYAVGALADLLNGVGGWEGIFPMLGQMDEVPPENGVPEGWQGTSGMRIYPAGNVKNRIRVLA